MRRESCFISLFSLLTRPFLDTGKKIRKYANGQSQTPQYDANQYPQTGYASVPYDATTGIQSSLQGMSLQEQPVDQYGAGASNYATWQAGPQTQGRLPLSLENRNMCNNWLKQAIDVGMKELLQAIRQPPEHYLCHQVTKNPPHRILNSPRSHVLYLGMEKTLQSTGIEVTLVPRTLNREMGDMLQRSDPHRTHHFQNPIPAVTMVRVSTAVTMIRVSILMGLQNTDNVSNPTTALFTLLISLQAPSVVFDDGQPREKSRRSKHKGKGKAVAEGNAYEFRDERPQHGDSIRSGGRDPRRPSGTSNHTTEFLHGQGASFLSLQPFASLIVT